MSSRHFCFLGDTSGFTGECRSFHSLTTAGFQKASRLGLPSRSVALGIVGFFFEGETNFVGLGGARGGVVGREMGGALHGDRCLVGVGEYVRMASAPLDIELVGREDAAKDSVRVREGGGRMNEAGGSGELVRSTTSWAQFEIVLLPFLCGGRIEVSIGGSWLRVFSL